MSTYQNPLSRITDLDGWRSEGAFHARETDDGLEFGSSGGLLDHWVLWCPETFGDRIRMAWDFSPRAEPGLAMAFFGARSLSDGDVLGDGVRPRTGEYAQYHSSDIRTLHLSYFRRRWPVERAFHLCNLRKSPGAHIVAQGADPLPGVEDADAQFYRIQIVQDSAHVELSIDGLAVLSWTDDGATGPAVGGGRFGFRQMAPLRACYRDLEIEEL